MSKGHSRKSILMLEDGLTMEGISIGKPGTTGGEVCFNTGMTGYQEIYTDPSYFGQIIINTTAHIGNYGSFEKEEESDGVKFSGLICNEFSYISSRYNATSTLNDYLVKSGITGIAKVDTRGLVRHIRSKGAMNCIISSEIEDMNELSSRLKEIPNMDGLELSSKVSVKRTYDIGDVNSKIKIAVLDLGIKTSILKQLKERGSYIRVFPCYSKLSDMESFKPNGYFISNGPGDPSSTSYAIDLVKEILKLDRPMFGICLGHQILALANGLKTYKMHHGHRGLNHPVKNLITGRSEITSQNHGFNVQDFDFKEFPNVEVTHLNLNDNSIEGIRLKDKPAFSVQYHPESSPGPHDSRYLFDNFFELIQQTK